jgi:hypothetical protein
MPRVVELAFVSSPGQNWFFHELIETLGHELTALGVPWLHSVDGFPDPAPDRVYVIVPPHEFVALEGGDPFGRDPSLLWRTVFICAEQPSSVHFEPNVELSRRAGAVFDINAESVRQLRRRGVAAEHLALGYTSRWDHYAPDSERDIDVLFMGCRTHRRTRHLASYARALSGLNCHFQLSDNEVPNVEGSPSFLTDDKWRLLMRSKLIINLHQADEPYFEWLRALDAIHCGCAILSEHSVGYTPLEPGRDLFVGAAESLGLLAESLVADPARLTNTARNAFELIRDRRPMSRAVQRLVSVASRLTIGPAPVFVPRRSRERPQLQRHVAATRATLDVDASVIRRALKDARLDAVDLRRRLVRLEAILSSPTHAAPPQVRRVFTTAAWTDEGDARVTVITALFNHASEIVEALDSVARSTYRDYELVVVDDGSADRSLGAAEDWLRSHPEIPGALIAHPSNRGLAHARNTAIDFARGEFCFVLDSDNEVYPRCLEALVRKLDSDPRLAFAYPILEVFGHAAAHVSRDGDHFVSGFSWDPSWLRTHNYIDAMALIRTSVLRDLGGYALDRRLHGVEDWDLWCRIADRGLDGAQVAQPLGRYRASPSSMISLSGISLTSVVAALVERSPNLLAGVTPPM